MAEPDRSERLLELAAARFGEGLTPADRQLFQQAANGKVAHYGDGDPAHAANWGVDRVLQADRIRWLCTDPEAVKEVLPHVGIWIHGARIGGELRLSYAKIQFPLAIEKSAIPDGIVMERAHVAALFLGGTHTGSITADGLKVDHDLFLFNGFKAEGEVRLLGATIGGILDCSKGHFSNPNGYALSADTINVEGSVFLRNGLKAEGRVSLLDATIGGNLECHKGHFSNPNGYALSTDRINVEGSVFLRDGFKAEGEVRLLGATIGGDLDCADGHFSNPNGTALNAQSIKVGSSVYLRDGFKPEGVVDFTGAEIGGFFLWRGVDGPERCTLDLESAKIGTLWDEQPSWPKNVRLDGLVYGRLYKDAPTDAEARLRWLALQESDRFLPQPYVQLASVLKEMGHDADAREILIAKVEDPARLKAMTLPQRAWHHVLGWTIGYGYRPWKAFGWILGFIVLGSILFGIGFHKGRFEVTQDGKPPGFNAVVYSLDTFVPLVDLHQAKYQLPTSWPLRGYLWIHISLGWVLTTLLAVGVTGLVRQ